MHRGGWPLRNLGDGDDYAFGTHRQRAALRVGANGVKLGVGFFLGADAGGVLGRAEIVDKIGADEEDAVLGFVFINFLCSYTMKSFK